MIVFRMVAPSLVFGFVTLTATTRRARLECKAYAMDKEAVDLAQS
jgi:hypothetical protein